MPIAFPTPNRGPDFFYPERFFNQIDPAVDVTDLGLIGRPFDNQDCLAPGLPIWFEGAGRAVNLLNMDTEYMAPGFEDGSRPNPAIQGPVPLALAPAPVGVVDPIASTVRFGFVNQSISGVTKDNTGAVLGSCEVRVFRTEDNLFIGSTTSDPTTGAWTLPLWAGGPFFLVEYKTGSPDKAGSSVRTLVATQS